MKIVNGVKLAEDILKKLSERIKFNNLHPRLDIIFIGNNFASQVYVNKKIEQAKYIGIDTELHHYESLTQDKLVKLLNTLNKDKLVDGILIQLPIQGDIDTKFILQHIDFEKDVDGLNPISLGYLWQNQATGFVSATPLAVLECLKHIVIYSNSEYSSEELNQETIENELKRYLSGKKVLVINHSNIVGKPLAALLLKYNTTLTIAHKYTKNLNDYVLNSDIVISGTGIPGLINKENIPEHSVLIDVGINDTAKGIGGDIDYTGAESKIDWITPVPGGVGPLTVAMLLSNVVKAHENKINN
jgi:methylenetetrahydrofolate dehydrogenase (NADP+) / methenyltetrahydrofolate cyclohydrolase